MPHALGSRSLSFAHHVDPNLMAVVNLAITRSAIDFGCTEDQSRTVAQQLAKVAAGVSHVRPGPAARHMIQPDGYSKAVDLVPWADGRFQWGDNQWRVTVGGVVHYAFAEIAEAMRSAAVELHTRVRWGAVWDRNLNDLPAGVPAMRQAIEAYKARHAGSDFLDGPHFELPL